MQVEIASGYTQLAFHALAHFRLAGPADLHEPAYVRWAAENLPRDAIEPITRDASIIATNAPGLSLQLAPELFDSIAQLRACAALEVDALGEDHLRSAAALREWRAIDAPGPELLRAALSLAAPAFETHWPRLQARCEEALDRHRAIFAHAATLSPALAGARVELAWPLGPRGRAFASRIVVGVPDDWSGLSPWTPAVVALHEATVRTAAGGYSRAEWAALIDVSARMRRADEAMRSAHTAWLSRLDVHALATAAAARGGCTKSEAEAIAMDRDGRAEHLAALAS